MTSAEHLRLMRAKLSLQRAREDLDMLTTDPLSPYFELRKEELRRKEAEQLRAAFSSGPPVGGPHDGESVWGYILVFTFVIFVAGAGVGALLMHHLNAR